MTTDLTLAARLSVDSQRWVAGLQRGMSATQRFAAGVRREFADLRAFMDSTAGRLAGLGGGFAAAHELMRSARMDRSLTQIGLTAGASSEQVSRLRGELFQMARETGRSVSDLESGFSTLIAGGMQWKEALPTLRAINRTMAVTGAQADTLAGTLGVASTAFNFDLAKAEQAQLLLDKMTVAGRLGNAELENLGDIFSRVGVNASRAGFGFEQTLAFIEGLSRIERQPERLATLADSTMRLFTNTRYLRQAQKTTGIRFFDEQGQRRDPIKVLEEIKHRYDTLKTDAARQKFLFQAFGEADLDTIKGISALLAGDNLAKVREFTRKIEQGSGTIEQGLPKAISNAADQAGRLRNTLLETADRFAQKINEPFARLTAKALDPKEKGGLELSGEELMGIGGGALFAAYLGKRFGKGLIARLGGDATSLAQGVAVGTALEKVGAATPVYVVGAAPGVFGGPGIGDLPTPDGRRGRAARRVRRLGRVGGLAAGARAFLGGGWRALAARAALAGGSSVGSLAGAGAAGIGTAAVGVTGAAAGGWAIGTGLYKALTAFDTSRAVLEGMTAPHFEMLDRIAALLGSEDAADRVRRADEAKLSAEIRVSVTDERTIARLVRTATDNGRFNLVRAGFNLGPMMYEQRAPQK